MTGSRQGLQTRLQQISLLSTECGKRHDKDTEEDETTDGESVSEVEDADVEEEDVGE